MQETQPSLALAMCGGWLDERSIVCQGSCWMSASVQVLVAVALDEVADV
jgi:hypothetical protein